jgi:hypothetical protein
MHNSRNTYHEAEAKHAHWVNAMPSSWAAKAAAARTSGSLVLIVEPAMQFLKPSADATSQLGAAAPWPQPPEPLVWATSGPAHLPDVKPQQPCWHSESDAHGVNTTFLLDWAAAGAAAAGAAAAGAGAAAAALFAAAGVNLRPSRLAVNAAAVWTAGSARLPFTAPATQSERPRAFATLQLGAAVPKPQPPSRVWATERRRQLDEDDRPVTRTYWQVQRTCRW